MHCCCSRSDVYESIERKKEEKKITIGAHVEAIMRHCNRRIRIPYLNNAVAYRKSYEIVKKEHRHEAITLLLELLKPAEHYVNDPSVLSALRELNIPVMVFIKMGGIFDGLDELFALL